MHSNTELNLRNLAPQKIKYHTGPAKRFTDQETLSNKESYYAEQHAGCRSYLLVLC